MNLSHLIIRLALMTLSTIAFAQSRSSRGVRLPSLSDEEQNSSISNQLRSSYGLPVVNFSVFFDHDTSEVPPSRVQDHFFDFARALQKLVGARPCSVHGFLGISGAGYAQGDRFATDFELAVRSAVSATKDRLGPGAVTVLVLDETLDDGFGAASDIILKLKMSLQIKDKDVVVVGMVSDQAVKKYLDGLLPGQIISPKQDLLLVTKTDTKGGNQAGVSKEGGADGSKIVDLLLRGDFADPSFTVMHVMEGGQQALEASMKMIVEAIRAQRIFKQGILSPEMRLYVGHRGVGEAAKLTVLNAATQMVHTLGWIPELKPEILKVTIQLAGRKEPLVLGTGTADTAGTVSEFFQNALDTAQEIETLEILIAQLKEGRNRLLADSDRIRGFMSQGSHPVNESATAGNEAQMTIERNSEMVVHLDYLIALVKKKLAGRESCESLLDVGAGAERLPRYRPD